MTSENKVLPAISGEVYFRDPEEDPPPKGAKLLILTSGNTALVSDWWDNSNFVAWSPLPSKKIRRSEVDDETKQRIIEDAVKKNMTITDSNLYEAVYSVAMDVAEEFEDRSYEDVRVMNEAQIVLQVIKDTDPGVYDEMIDNVLRLISEALNFK
jgi:hypothetical protein